MIHHIFTILGFHILVILLGLTLLISHRYKRLLPYCLAIFFGFLTAYLDIHADEVQFTVLLLLAFGIFLGYYERKSVWRWGILLALWIPLFQLARVILESRFQRFIPEGLGSAIAFLPSMVGSYIGSFLRGATKEQETVS